MAERDYIALVADLVKDAENYRNELSADRIKAIEYYDGKMMDTESDKGRSSVVSRDVRAKIQKVLPALTRTFLANEKIVEFQPAQQGDEAGAEQATDYLNSVVFVDCDGPKAIEDSIHDALKLRNGVLHWYYDEKTSIEVSRHSGLDEDAFAALVNEQDVQVLEHTAREEVIDGVPSTAHDCKIKRTTVKRIPKLDCLRMEQFLIHSDALDEDSAAVIGHVSPVRRSDLVAMGYDKDLVWTLPAQGSSPDDKTESDTARRTFVNGSKSETTRELDEIEFYNVYVRIDTDGDGIAELRLMRFGGKISAETLLEDEEADEVPYAIIKVKTKPHQWEGISIADDMMEIQRIKTVLLRQTMDNVYWQNNQQLGVRSDLLEPESASAVTNPQFGQTVFLKPGASAAEAIQPIVVPFIAEKSFAMIEYWDHEGDERTGINDASGGLPPDALQNVTAKASAMYEQQGIGQAELMARTLAQGFRRMFRGMLRLVIRHQDKPRTVRLRNDWVAFDPRQWNSNMDCIVNTGLGAGTRERDTSIMMAVMAAQKEIIAGFGPDNPYVTPQNLGNALFRFAEASGLRTPDMYFSKPTPEQTQQMIDSIRNKPDPEVQKIQAKTQADIQIKQMDMQAQQFKERVQGEAAVMEAREKAQIEAQDKEAERALKKYEIDTKAQIELLKLEKQQAFEREKAQAATQENPMDRERMVMEFEMKREMAEREFMLKRDLGYADAALRAQQGMAKESSADDGEDKESGNIDAVMAGFSELANSIREVGGAIIQSNTRAKTVKKMADGAFQIG